MKIKYFLVLFIFTAGLSLGVKADAQVPNFQNMIVQMQNQISQLTAQLNTLQGQQGQDFKIRVLSPNGGETFFPGEKIVIRWESQGLSAGDKVYVTYSNNDPDANQVNLTSVIDYNIPAVKGSYVWQLPKDLKDGPFYKINIYTELQKHIDSSDDYFAVSLIKKDPVKVTSPNGGETLKKGGAHFITWEAESNLVSDIFLKENGALSCTSFPNNLPIPCVYTIAQDVNLNNVWRGGVGKVEWKISNGRIQGSSVSIPSGRYTLQLCTESRVCDESDNHFFITSTGSFNTADKQTASFLDIILKLFGL